MKRKGYRMSASTTWIAIGVILGAIAAFSLPYGFYLKSQEKKTKTTIEQPPIAIGKIEKSGDIIGRDKIIYDHPIITSAEDSEQTNTGKKVEIAKIKINRYLADCKLNIEELKQEYFKESTLIAENMSERGILRSSIHIKAQMEYAVEIKKKVDSLFTQLTRNIEDNLLESFNTNLLSQAPSLQEEYSKYNSLKEMNKKIYKEMEDNVKSWNVKISGSIGITKDFTFE